MTRESTTTVTAMTLAIEGMHCGGCVQRVRRALEGLDGVTVDAVDVGQAQVRFDPAAIDVDDIVAAVAKAGYPATRR